MKAFVSVITLILGELMIRLDSPLWTLKELNGLLTMMEFHTELVRMRYEDAKAIRSKNRKPRAKPRMDVAEHVVAKRADGNDRHVVAEPGGTESRQLDLYASGKPHNHEDCGGVLGSSESGIHMGACFDRAGRDVDS